MTRYLSAFGRQEFLLGVNYWSRAGGPRMWEAGRFDPRTIEAEIATMRTLGLNACRAFLFLPTFMPQPPEVDRGALERFSGLVAACARAGLAVLPSLLVGHMSGENFDFPGQRGRSPYADPEVVSWERALARAACGAVRGSPALSAWVLSNEMPLWGGPGAPPTIAAWCKLLRDEVHAASGGVPFGTGDGVMNLRGGQNGFDPELLASVVDYLGPHAYPADTDPLRQSLYCELAVRSLQHLKKPILFEEFGCSSAQAGAAEQSAWWRETVYTCMSIGAAGALGWCFSDFALGDEVPYRHHAFELGFGIVGADGSPKPVATELAQAARWVEALDWPSLDFETPRAAIVRPSVHETTYPFSWDDRSRMTHGLLQAYTLARKAGLEAAFVPESHPLDAFDLVLVPATQKLLAPTWERLLRRAHEGGQVYWSWFGGDYDFHQGAWCHRFEELTGCRMRLRYGVPDLPPERLVVRGDGLALETRTDAAAGAPFARAFVPVEPVDAGVLARDERGRPMLVRHAIGRGAVWFLCCPWESYLGAQADINGADGSHRLYARLASAAGIAPGAGSPCGRVQTHRVGAGAEDLVFALNRSWDEVEARIDAPGGEGPFAPKEARVLRRPR